MKNQKTKKRNFVKAFSIFSVGTIVYLFLSVFNIIDKNMIIEQGKDFHYNMVTVASILGGFLFTGISVLISSLEKERISRLWKAGHLNLLYYSSFFGISLCVATIIVSLSLLTVRLSNVVVGILCLFETYTIFISVIFFIVCIKELGYVISRLKPEEPTEPKE